jgi:hypothetical protein
MQRSCWSGLGWWKWLFLAGAVGLGFVLGRTTAPPPVKGISAPPAQVSPAVNEVSHTLADDLLRALVRRECPELRDPELGDWERVNRLRDWAFANIDKASDSAQLIRRGWYSRRRSAAEHFVQFFNDAGGVKCSGAAFVLQKLYQLFGYRAFTVHSGIAGSRKFGHSVTLVEIAHAGRRLLSIQDAHYGITFADESGQPLDYLDFLQAIRDQDWSRVRVVPGAPAARDFLYDSHDEWNYVVEESVPPVQLTATRWRYRSAKTFATFQQGAGRALRRELARRGLPANVLGLFLFVKKIYEGPEGDQLLARARAVAGCGRW